VKATSDGEGVGGLEADRGVEFVAELVSATEQTRGTWRMTAGKDGGFRSRLNSCGSCRTSRSSQQRCLMASPPCTRGFSPTSSLAWSLTEKCDDTCSQNAHNFWRTSRDGLTAAIPRCHSLQALSHEAALDETGRNGAAPPHNPSVVGSSPTRPTRSNAL